MEKDCVMIFGNQGQQRHEFRARDLDLALKWAHDSGIEYQCIHTPWGTLTTLDDETYNKAMGTFQ